MERARNDSPRRRAEQSDDPWRRRRRRTSARLLVLAALGLTACSPSVNHWFFPNTYPDPDQSAGASQVETSEPATAAKQPAESPEAAKPSVASTAAPQPGEPAPATTPEPPRANPTVTQPTYDLVLAGSNTIGGVDPSTQRGLARDLVIAFCKAQWPGGALLEDKLLSVPNQVESERVIAYKLPTGDVRRIVIRPHGSKTAVDALKQGDPALRADIGMSSSPRAELQAGWNEYVVALDAVAVIANPRNPVDELTLQDLREIFGPNPKKNTWDGGLGAIHTFGRDKKSGTSELLRSFTGIDAVLGSLGKTADAAIPFTGAAKGQPGADGFEDSARVIEQVRKDPAAIGFVGRAASLPLGDVRAVAIRPNQGYPAFAPNLVTIRTMEYSMTRQLYFYTSEQPRSLAADFVRYVLSDPGQTVVDEAGFVGFHTSNLLAPANVAKTAPDPLKKAVQNSDRVLISFRFRHGVADSLDAISARNLARLNDALRLPGNSDRKLLIVGHVDSSGNPKSNLKLSQDRARYFAGLLQRQGVGNAIEDTLGFGSDYLLYDDKGNPDSREAQLNRRVDVYLRR
ncbi:MAG: phosphate ABC transporter substrate-binding/OmpA family protein [Polyangiales bacterium]